jgi:hypothetical protein
MRAGDAGENSQGSGETGGLTDADRRYSFGAAGRARCMRCVALVRGARRTQVGSTRSTV